MSRRDSRIGRPEPEVEVQLPGEEVSDATPLEQLRALAAGASSESVRVQALRVLLDREEGVDRPVQVVERVPPPDDEVLAELDRNLAAFVLAVAYGREPGLELPETAAAVAEVRAHARGEGERAAVPVDSEPGEPSEAAGEPEPVADVEPVSLAARRRDAPPGLEPEDVARAWGVRPRRRRVRLEL